MPRYKVYFITKLSKHVGSFDAASEDDAIEMAAEGDAYQDIGGACHQCTDNLGDADDGEFIAFEDKPAAK
jgi:hypothetical protein